ncbi:hypothetical protein ACH4U6_12840 [Streptomyces netropsis]|uniref:hypothetical protein n=1 Tax=Streptomyces netropsis TaxID=55404 RepID=UPI0037A092AD
MRIKLASTAIAAVCGSLALGVTAPALAAAPEPGRVVAVAAAPTALEETVSLGHRIVREARSASPDVAKLGALQQQLRAAVERAPDPLDELEQALDKLIEDVTKIVDEVERKDAAATTLAADTVAADLMDIPKGPTAMQKEAASLPVPLPLQ